MRRHAVRSFGLIGLLGAFFSISVSASSESRTNELRILQVEFSQSSFAKECSAWPPLDDIAAGTPFERTALSFLALPSGKTLIRIRCQTGAYNERALFFLEDPKSHLRLVMFPTAGVDAEWALKPFEAAILERDYDPKTGILYVFAKGLGDGSIGYYLRYRFGASDDLPRLERIVQKKLDDHQETYDFNRSAEPQGKNWIRFTPAQPLKGCLTSLGHPAC
jgi:hypothetical protein